MNGNAEAVSGGQLLQRRISPRREWRWGDLLFRLYLAALVGPVVLLAASEVVARSAELVAIELPVTAPDLHASTVVLLTVTAAAALTVAPDTRTSGTVRPPTCQRHPLSATKRAAQLGGRCVCRPEGGTPRGIGPVSGTTASAS